MAPATSPDRPAPTAPDPFDALAGWLALLPGLVLCWPLPGPLSDVPTTASAAAGWSALLVLPGLVLVAARRRTPWRATPRWVVGLGVLVAWTLLASWTPLGPLAERAGDRFEARRATLVVLTAAGSLLTGAGLGPAGRRAAVRAAGLLPLLLGLGALLTGRVEGVLGNVGDGVEVAAPCALVALAWFVLGRGFQRGLALLSAVAFAVLCGLGSSLVGLVGYLAPLALALVLLPRAPRLGRVVRIGIVVGLLASALFLGHQRLAGAGPGDDAAAQPTAPLTAVPEVDGGLTFRRLTWARVPALLRDHPLGVGPGQFPRAFPPYRDPRELLLSSHDRREPTPVVVEHAHHDGLELLVEHGLPVGGLAVLLLAALGFAALRTLARAGRGRSEDTADDDAAPDTDAAWRSGLALGVLGLLTVGLANGALTYGVASPAVGLALAGALVAPVEERRPRPTLGLRLGPEWLAVALLAAHGTDARDLVRHGQALAGLADAHLQVLEDGVPTDKLDAEAAARCVARALRAAPDSVAALEKRAQVQRFLVGVDPALVPELPRDRQEREHTLRRILQARPDDLAALTNLGVLYAQEGLYGRAAEHFERALVLDPDNPALLRNRLQLALDAGQVEPTRRALAELEARTELDEADLADLRRAGLRQLRLGRLALAHLLLERVDPELDVRDANACWQRAQAARDAGLEDREDAFLTGAHLHFARDHAARGSWGDAVRSYRQAARFSARAGEHPQGSPLVRVELAAALWSAGDPDAARAELRGLTVQAQDLLHLDPSMGQVLIDAGLLNLSAGEQGTQQPERPGDQGQDQGDEGQR